MQACIWDQNARRVTASQAFDPGTLTVRSINRSRPYAVQSHRYQMPEVPRAAKARASR
jgi:hypothetical protein